MTVISEMQSSKKIDGAFALFSHPNVINQNMHLTTFDSLINKKQFFSIKVFFECHKEVKVKLECFLITFMNKD